VRHSRVTPQAPGADPADFLRHVLGDWHEDDLVAVAEAKRVWEMLLADAGLRAEPPATRQHAAGFAPFYNVLVDGAAWSDIDLARWPEVELFLAWREQLQQHRGLLRRYPDAVCTNPRFAAWRAREMARAASELGGRDAALAHPVVAYELSSGCTLGCWFCGIGAETFRGHAAYASHGPLWRETVAAVADALGPAARTGVCFGATDPFDNPDYDRFIRDHHEITGALPSTTTAAPLRDLAMTRALLDRSLRDGPVLNRFSILTARVMAGVLAAFTPRELLLVDLIPQMPGSLLPKADAGRARTGSGGRRPASAMVDSGAATIACVSGFLINLPERRIRLVSPCRASDTWPLGYRVYADSAFTDGADLTEVIASMIERFMPVEVPLNERMRLRSDLQLVKRGAAIRLHNAVTAHDVSGHDFIPALTGMLVAGDRSLGEVAGHMAAGGAPYFDVLRLLQRLYDAALLDPVSLPGADHNHAERSTRWN
jgi:radical SAM family RiPP maturation amino acid epimerase